VEASAPGNLESDERGRTIFFEGGDTGEWIYSEGRAGKRGIKYLYGRFNLTILGIREEGG